MQIAILTFDGFNELDSFVAAAILNRLKSSGWAAHITAPTECVTSMNGVTVTRQRSLDFAAEADAVIIGSGVNTREIAADTELLAHLHLDPKRQLIGAQCSGTLVLAKLGLIGTLPACTDLTTKPWVIEAGIDVLDAPFVAHGNVATAGGCMASAYLAAWIIDRGASTAAARDALHYVAPVGEKVAYVDHALGVIRQSALRDGGIAKLTLGLGCGLEKSLIKHCSTQDVVNELKIKFLHESANPTPVFDHRHGCLDGRNAVRLLNSSP
ncbi:AraC family transcriptional regulator [Sphingomonas koreensis]|nr:AraC family transcriptional regulator [Sphingomonas koreensis]